LQVIRARQGRNHGKDRQSHKQDLHSNELNQFWDLAKRRKK